jgi:hypothetical protein
VSLFGATVLTAALVTIATFSALYAEAACAAIRRRFTAGPATGPGLAPHMPHPGMADGQARPVPHLAAAAERIADLEAVAAARRAPVTVTTADLPAAPATILLPDEAELLAQITGSCDLIPHTGAVLFEGVNIADFLRRRLPAASDAELARVVVCWLFTVRHIVGGTDDMVSAVGALWESLGAAAIHLTELERADAR